MLNEFVPSLEVPPPLTLGSHQYGSCNYGLLCDFYMHAKLLQSCLTAYFLQFYINEINNANYLRQRNFISQKCRFMLNIWHNYSLKAHCPRHWDAMQRPHH